MNHKRLRQMYGSTPPGFEQRVQAALSGQSPRAEAGCGGRSGLAARRTALIAALMLLAAAVAVAAFQSQVAAYFGWFYGGETREQLEAGDTYALGETMRTPDAAYILEEVVRTAGGLYGVGRAVPAEGVVLMPGDALPEDASALDAEDLTPLPGTSSYLERAREAGARLVAVKVTPHALGAPETEETPVDAAGYLLFPLEDGSLRFSFEIPAEGAPEENVMLTLWVSRWEVAPDGQPLRGGDGDTYERREWRVIMPVDE